MKLIALALCFIFLVNGQNILAELDKIAEKNEYGKLFKELLDLKMKNQKIDEVIELIGALLKQLREDQQTDDIESLQKQAAFDVDIQILQGLLEISRGQLRTANQAIIDISAENAALTRSKVSLSKQIGELNGKEQELRDARSEEEKNYEARQFSTQKVLDALNDIIKRLTDAVLGQSFTEIQRKEIVTKIKNELGQNNPIAMLISLTSKFDGKTVTGIIEKLENLRSAVLASVVSDEQSEQEAKLAFQAILLQVNDVRDRLSNDLTDTVSRLRRREVEYSIAQRQSNELQQQIPQNEELLAITKRQQELDNTVYQNRKRKRSQEIEVVEAALQVVRTVAASQ